MSRKISAEDYPEHLNPFDENYNGVLVADPPRDRQKYNTWGTSRANQVSTLAKQKPSFLEKKPWAVLNISPKGKIVRRLSILKTAVERFSSKKNRLSHSTSFSDANLPPRSNSVHDEFRFKIVSPKVKEKLRQQAFSRSISKQDQDENNSTENPNSPQLNGRLAPSLQLEARDPAPTDDCPSSAEPDKEFNLGARPKTRKKRPPPPPPTEVKSTTADLPNGQEQMEDSLSANSSITHDLEKDVSSEEDSSLAEINKNTKMA